MVMTELSHYIAGHGECTSCEQERIIESASNKGDMHQVVMSAVAKCSLTARKGSLLRFVLVGGTLILLQNMGFPFFMVY